MISRREERNSAVEGGRRGREREGGREKGREGGKEGGREGRREGGGREGGKERGREGGERGRPRVEGERVCMYMYICFLYMYNVQLMITNIRNTNNIYNVNTCNTV